MEIRKLEELTGNPMLLWGPIGYRTDKIFVVSAIEIGTSFEFSLREKDQPYTKTPEINSGAMEQLNAIIGQGHSFGVFHEDELIGLAICDYRESNNSLFIKNLLVREAFRGQNIGRLLIKNINREARDLQCRIVETETQNTNYPAIQFYRKAGFAITGINTKLYNDSTETALFMSFELV
ncbi:GNAT family N-acetyltransferase [Chryseobacterium sp. SN22]|uniref:GNAT family N-acetyltransferase n=1 Tax=Chryseobacterium sp. SN22 TaxID=2606431 RepID=UPI0011F09B12|nr:GNAT family N-acetyltransferase [Chryseobacterium sp. SN22]KAA0127048.1 GNAT family N-acetyltransferase [Chryseobacterium sp. SN22]